MRLDEAFERVVVINLSTNANRRKLLLSQIKRTGIADIKKLRWTRGICGNRTPPPAWWGAGGGAWGCLMSHVRIAQDAAHDNLASYCVLEDDAIFHKRSQEMLASFVSELPSNWGQAYLGGQFLHEEPTKVSAFVMRPFNVNRTHAFALSKHTIPKFIRHILHAPDYLNIRADKSGAVNIEHNNFHIDHQLGRAHERRDWNTYCPTWWIAGQTMGPSHISGRINPELWWIWRGWGKRLPFFFLEANARPSKREFAKRYLHVGYNPICDTLIDIGIAKDLTDADLVNWLTLIAGEAIERWRLPGFEVPKDRRELPARVQKLWPAGLHPVDSHLMPIVADYPFNGLVHPTPPFAF